MYKKKYIIFCIGSFELIWVYYQLDTTFIQYPKIMASIQAKIVDSDCHKKQTLLNKKGTLKNN